MAVVARDGHSCWLLDASEAYATDDGGGPEVLEAPVHVAETSIEAAAIEESVRAILRVADLEGGLSIQRHGQREGPRGVDVEVVTVISAGLLEPDPSTGLDRVSFDEVLALLDDVQDTATLVGLRALHLERLSAPEPVWATRQAAVLEREGQADDGTLYLGRFDAGPWGETRMSVEDGPLDEALEWARGYAAHVVLYLGEKRYEAGARPSPNRYPEWDGTVPSRPGPD